MSTNDPLTSLLQAARKQSPFGEPEDFGFETRLRASLGDREPAFSEALARFSLRLSAVSLPLAIALVAFLAFQTSASLPEGLGGFVAHWSSFLPVDL